MRTPRSMRRRPFAVLLLTAAVLVLGVVYEQYRPAPAEPAPAAQGTDGALRRAFEERRGDLPVAGEGVVTAVLPDDRDGSRHQRFILEVEDGLTVLVAHNIDLAPRIEGLRTGDRVAFSGEYEWNPKGGVIHWTHHDPAGRRAGGWLEHAGRRYR